MNGLTMADQNDIKQANMAAQSVKDHIEDEDVGEKGSNQSPEDTHDSTKSPNSDDEGSIQSPEDTHDSTKSLMSDDESRITQRPIDQSLNTERKPKTWCCVLVGTKCRQIIADVPLLLPNASQLRAVFELDDENRFYIHLLTLVILSLLSYILLLFFNIIGWNLQNKHTDALKLGKKYEVNNDRVKFCCCCTKQYQRDEYNESDLCQCPYCHANLYLNSTCYILVFITICATLGLRELEFL